MLILVQAPAAAPQTPSAPLVPQAPPAFGTEPLTALRAQAQAFVQQLDGLEAQRRATLAQMKVASSPAKQLAMRDELLRIDGQIIQATTELANVRAEIRVRQQAITEAPPPRVVRQRGPDSDAIAAMSIVFMLVTFFPISLALARRIWRRSPKPSAVAGAEVIAPRLDRLEQAVDAIAIEVERISEGQRFVTRVLTERPVPARPSTAPESNDAAAVGEAKPLRAIGAGPIEPIRVAERQAVRQSVTPH